MRPIGDDGEKVLDALQPPGDLATVTQQETAHLDVLPHRHVREQGVVLRHLDDPQAQDLSRVPAPDLLTVEQDAAQARA